MRRSSFLAGLCASALLCAGTASQGAEQSALPGLPSYEGTRTIGTGSVNIESTMLASTAVDAAATEIAGKLPANGHVIILAGTESIDFNQVAMIEREMTAITKQLRSALDTPTTGSPEPGDPVITANMLPPAVAPAMSLISGLAGLMRSNVELTGVDITIAPRVLAAAIAAKMPNRAVLPAEAVGVELNGPLITAFSNLEDLADQARAAHDQLAVQSPQSPSEQTKLDRLAAALDRYDKFFTRVTTADKGVVPIVAADRFATMLARKPLILRVNTDKTGGTVVKRTNLLTFLGADAVRISGGLVASYQLTEPNSGQVTAAGVVTCRTALTTLRSVQDTTWKPAPRRGNESQPQPDPTSNGPAAVCRTIVS